MTITLIISRKPYKFLSRFKSLVKEESRGIYHLLDHWIDLHVINIEEAKLLGSDGLFLSTFMKDIEKMKAINERRILQNKEIKNKQVVDELLKSVNDRLTLFEGEKLMSKAVADITHLVVPELEKAEKRGKRKGKREGKREGIEQTALNLLKNEAPIDLIVKSTGLSKKQIERLNL